MSKKVVAIIGAAVAASLLIPIALIAGGVVIITVISGGAASEYAALDDCENPNVRSTVGAYSGIRNPTEDQIAGTIYSQAMGLGLGETGALIGIATAIDESGGMQNLKAGDPTDGVNENFKLSKKYGGGTAPADLMSDSRGVFQQRQSYPPEGSAWSGQKWSYYSSKAQFSNFRFIGTDPENLSQLTDDAMYETDNANPWDTGTRWAVADPRMDPAQAANMFFLGAAGSNGAKGLEYEIVQHSDEVKNTKDPLPPPEAFTDFELGEFSYRVQISGAKKRDPVTNAITEYAIEEHLDEAREYLQRIQSLEIPVPEFVAPLPDIAKQADTRRVKQALRERERERGDVDSGTPVNATDIAGDGLVLIGDSVMAGIVSEVDPPEELIGGPLVRFYMPSMRLPYVLDREKFRAGPGIKDAQGLRTTSLDRWRNAISSPETPSRILVSLGTNGGDTNTRADVDRFMALAGQKQVYWLSQHDSRAQKFNDVLLQAAADYPNLTVVDISSVPGIDTTLPRAHPWEGALEDPRTGMWNRAINTIRNGEAPNVIQTIECGGGSVFVGDIPAASLEAANAVKWALSRIGGTYDFVEGDPRDTVTPGSVNQRVTADSYHFNCSGLTYMAYKQAGVDWGFGCSSVQWANTEFMLIPSSEALPGDLVWFNHPEYTTPCGGAANHVGIISRVENGEVHMVEAVTSGIKETRIDDGYNQPFLAPPDLSNPQQRDRSESGMQRVNNWSEAWVGRIKDGTPMPGSGVLDVSAGSDTLPTLPTDVTSPLPVP